LLHCVRNDDRRKRLLHCVRHEDRRN
jgi:hypothetical protein